MTFVAYILTRNHTVQMLYPDCVLCCIFNSSICPCHMISRGIFCEIIYPKFCVDSRFDFCMPFISFH